MLDNCMRNNKTIQREKKTSQFLFYPKILLTIHLRNTVTENVNNMFCILKNTLEIKSPFFGCFAFASLKCMLKHTILHIDPLWRHRGRWGAGAQFIKY